MFNSAAWLPQLRHINYTSTFKSIWERDFGNNDSSQCHRKKNLGGKEITKAIFCQHTSVIKSKVGVHGNIATKSNWKEKQYTVVQVRWRQRVVIHLVDLGVKHMRPSHCNNNPSPLFPWRGLLKINLGWSTVNNMFPRGMQFNPHSSQCIKAQTRTQIHIPLNCLSIVRGKYYWPISELNVPTFHPPGNPLSPPPPAFIVLSCYHIVMLSFIHVAPLDRIFSGTGESDENRCGPIGWF